MLLGLLLLKVLPASDEMLGKYGLCEGERGLVGGVSKGEERRPGMLREGLRYREL